MRKNEYQLDDDLLGINPSTKGTFFSTVKDDDYFSKESHNCLTLVLFLQCHKRHVTLISFDKYLSNILTH